MTGRHSMRLSFLLAVHNTPFDALDEVIKCVVRQSHSGWEMCICDDSSTSSATIELLETYRGADARIKIVRSPERLGVAKATNIAAEFATGQFVALLHQDVIIELNVLYRVMRAIDLSVEADVLYVDEDKIDAERRRTDPVLKPDWSPELLLSMMYLGRFLIVRKSLFLGLGGLRDGYPGAQEYDLALRATAQARQVVHVPGVLCHFRKDATSHADVRSPTTSTSAKRALAEFVRQQATDAKVVDGLIPQSYRVKWPIDATRTVTLVVLTGSRRRVVPGRGDLLLVDNMIQSIVERSSYRNYRLLVLDDGALPTDVRGRFDRAGVRVEDYRFEGALNYYKKLNHALSLVETEDVIVLNDDLEVIAPDWIEALLEHSQRPEIGVVGALLLYPSDRIQHAGIVLGVNGPTTHIFCNLPADEPGYCGFTHVIRNCSAVTGAVHATRMSVVREMGFFDLNMAVDYGDADFCLRVQEAGYRVVYTPYAKLYHFEGSSFVRKEPNEADQAFFVARWRDRIAADPYYSSSLPKDRVDCHVTRW